MITERDRINTCIEKYGLVESEARRIVKENDMLLSVDELRMKFDNPSLGKEYPEWLNPIDHYKMCCATTRQMYNGNFANICTPTELASTLFIKSSIKLNTFKNFQHLKTGLITMAMTICRDGMRRQEYWCKNSIDSIFDDDTKLTFYDVLVARDKEKEEQDCLNAVLSIKNREVREILILAGYIIGGIDSFAVEFKRIVQESDIVNIEKLYKLLDEIKQNDENKQHKCDDKSYKFKNKRFSLKSILNVIKTDLDLTSARLEIGEYLKITGFITI